MMDKLLTTLFAILITNAAFTQTYLPKCNGELIKHKYFSLSYLEDHEQAEWVAYDLTKELVSGKTKRTNNFRKDPKVSTYSAELIDYQGSGYDRGHLCPAASMDLNKKAMSETFYLSNMSPQVPDFNRIGWKKIETQVRTWVIQNGLCHIVTGPVFKDNKGEIGLNRVTVPGYFYKVIFNSDTDHMIGFLCPNEKLGADLSDYIRTVDEIEKETGLDFFEQLDDELEDRLEKTVDIEFWNIN